MIFVTVASPNDLQWLKLADARRLGIDAALLPPMGVQHNVPPAQPSATQTPPPRPPRAGNVTLEQAAQGFLADYFGRWSEPNPAAMAYVQGLYADRVDFYGGATPRQTILDLKRKFIERWPQRRYSVRPESVKINCNEGEAACSISGLVDWECRSPTRGARSVGLAKFAIRVAFDRPERPQVVAESGSVLSRSTQ